MRDTEETATSTARELLPTMPPAGSISILHQRWGTRLYFVVRVSVFSSFVEREHPATLSSIDFTQRGSKLTPTSLMPNQTNAHVTILVMNRMVHARKPRAPGTRAAVGVGWGGSRTWLTQRALTSEPASVSRALGVPSHRQRSSGSASKHACFPR